MSYHSSSIAATSVHTELLFFLEVFQDGSGGLGGFTLVGDVVL